MVTAMNRPDFWHQRWRRGEIGFHRADVHPLLQRFWPDVAGGSLAPVLVPLAGKSLDMRWLAARGHAVTGVEIDPIAVQAFFDEAGLRAGRDGDGALIRWQAGPFTLWQGDFFDFRAASGFELFYDRAALVALPPDFRPRYLEHLAAQFAPGGVGLLITLEYRQQDMNGPPYSVPQAELAACDALAFEPLSRVDALDSHPRFAERGLRALRECAYRVSRPAER